MMQLILIVLTKRKETIRYYESTNVSIVLTELLYLQKMDQTSISWDFH
jgi:hypothetical protein